MIQLRKVSKFFVNGSGRTDVLRPTSLALKSGETVALLGRNGAGKSTFLRMLAGITRPSAGVVERSGSVSWPVAFSGGLHGDMSGAANIRFVARIYGRDSASMLIYCREMSGLGDHLSKPVRTYSSGMRARLAFAMSMAVPFDFYLIDEVVSVGDASFRQKSEDVLAQRLARTGGIVVSHAPKTLRRLCQKALILENGRLVEYPSVDAALAAHQSMMQAVP